VKFDRNGQVENIWKVVQFQGSASTTPAYVLPGPGAVSPFLPTPPWRERNCRLQRSWNTQSGLSERSIWGYVIPEYHFHGHEQVHFRGVAAPGDSGPEYELNATVAGDAFYFAALIMGFSAEQASDYGIVAKSTALAWAPMWTAISARRGSSADVREWLRRLAIVVFDGMPETDNEIGFEAAAAYFLTPDRNSQICSPCPYSTIAIYDPELHMRRCVACFGATPAVSRSDDLNKSIRNLARVERQCVSECSVDGQAAINASSGSCEDCPAGKSSQDGICVDCQPGRFASRARQTACTKCPPGTYIDVFGARDCIPCQAGEEASHPGTHKCYKCTRGTFSPEPGTPLCELCDKGRIAPDIGQKACQICQPGMYSVHNATRCEICPAGKYQNLPEKAECHDAPEGADKTSDTPDHLSNLAMYWVRKKDLDLSWEFCTDFPLGCLAGETCGRGSTGVKCTACVPGYARMGFLDSSTSSCFECPPMWLNSISLAVALLFVLGLTAMVASFAVMSDERPQDLQITLFKDLCLYFVVTSVASDVMGRVVMARRLALGAHVTGVCTYLCELLMLGSGWVLTETPVFSLHCFFQYFVKPSDSDQLAESLTSIRHSQWFDDSNDASRESLSQITTNAELYRMLFWAVWPLALVVLTYLFSFTFLSLKLLCRSSFHQKALAFYDELVQTSVEEVKKKGMEEWTLFVREYSSRLCGIWWLVPHADARRQGRCLEFGFFVKETLPIVLTGFLLSYANVLVGVLRPHDCEFFPADGFRRQIFATERRCSWTDRQSIISTGCGLFWGVLAPMLLLLAVRSRRHAMLKLVMIRARFAILINGYTDKCWWWEFLIFALKGFLISVKHHSVPAEAKNGMLLMAGMVYSAAHVFFQPLDSRCDRVLQKVHYHLLVAWILQSTAVDFIALVNKERNEMDEVGAWCTLAAAVIVLVAHLSFLAHISYRMYRFTLESYMSTFDWVAFEAEIEQAQEHFGGPGLYLRQALLNAHERHHRESPYVFMDPLFGWAVVIGSRGDLAAPPKIPRGHKCPEGRPALSSISASPEDVDVRQATPAQRDWLQRALGAAVEALAVHLDTATFSVSLLEFVMRAAFVLARRKTIASSKYLSSSYYWEDFEDVVDLAAAELDLLDIIDENKADARNSQEEFDLPAFVRASMLVKAKGHLGRTHNDNDNDNDLVEKAFAQKAQVVLQDELNRRAVDAGAASASVVAQMNSPIASSRKHSILSLSPEARAMSEQRKSLKRAGRHARLEESLRLLTDQMFHPLVYKTGIELEAMQLALMELVRIRQQDLTLWLDIFEETWLKHNAYQSNRIRRYAGSVKDQLQQTDITVCKKPAGRGGALWDAENCNSFMEDEIDAGSGVGSFLLFRNMHVQVGESYVQPLKPPEGLLPAASSAKLMVPAPATEHQNDGAQTAGARQAPAVTEPPLSEGRWGTTWAWAVARSEEDLATDIALDWMRFVLKAGHVLHGSDRLNVASLGPLLKDRRQKKARHLQETLEAEEQKCRAEEEAIKAIEEHTNAIRLRMGMGIKTTAGAPPISELDDESEPFEANMPLSTPLAELAFSYATRL